MAATVKTHRKLKMGMVGGGPGAFIGAVHRRAAQFDGDVELVAGAFSSDPGKSAQAGHELYLDPKRVYPSYAEMARAEALLPAGERIDFVTIVTPNYRHYCVAECFLKAGFHVMCEKPMTFNLAEARKLHALVRKTGLIFALMHNYTGYPMVKLARDLARGGHLGTLRKIQVEYPQGYLNKLAISGGGVAQGKESTWRVDPAIAGASNCMGDIGTHAENLAEYISGLKMVQLCADLTTFVKGRRLEDDGNVLVHWENGVKGILSASQISVGHENDLSIRVYGEDAGLEWKQEHPNQLHYKRSGEPIRIMSRGTDHVASLSAAAAAATRLPWGHPEAFYEAFANVYRGACSAIRAAVMGGKIPKNALDYPDADSGLRGMLFLDAVLKSAKAGAKWVKVGK